MEEPGGALERSTKQRSLGERSTEHRAKELGRVKERSTERTNRGAEERSTEQRRSNIVLYHSRVLKWEVGNSGS